MLRLVFAIALILSFVSANACEKRHFKYRKAVPEKYAEAALLEYGAGSVTTSTKPTVLAGSSCDGTTIVAVLYTSQDGTYYVGLVLNANNQMEVKSRGVTSESVAKITERFSNEAFVLPDMPPE